MLAGTGPFTGVAVAFVVLSALFVVAAALSSTSLQWTGRPVRGTYRDGLVSYQYQGQHYALADPAASTFHETTVFVDPADPANAMLDNPFDRGLDIASVVAPLLLAAFFFALGVRRRRRRGAAADGRSFGHGLDRETVEWLRERQRGGRLTAVGRQLSTRAALTYQLAPSGEVSISKRAPAPPPLGPHEHVRGTNSTEQPREMTGWLVYGVANSAATADGTATSAAAAWSCFFQSSMNKVDAARGEACGSGGSAMVVVVAIVVIVVRVVAVVVGAAAF